MVPALGRGRGRGNVDFWEFWASCRGRRGGVAYIHTARRWDFRSAPLAIVPVHDGVVQTAMRRRFQDEMMTKGGDVLVPYEPLSCVEY